MRMIKIVKKIQCDIIKDMFMWMEISKSKKDAVFKTGIQPLKWFFSKKNNKK